MVPEGVVLRGQYDRLDWIAAELLLLNCQLTVREPPELVDALQALAERAWSLVERGVNRGEHGGNNP